MSEAVARGADRAAGVGSGGTEAIAGSRVAAWVLRDPEARAQRLVGCLFDDGRSDTAWEIQAWSAGSFTVQAETGRGPVRKMSFKALEQGNVEIPIGKRDLVREISAQGSPTWDAAAHAYARKFNLGAIDDERLSGIIRRMQETLSSFDPKAASRAEGIDPDILVGWCLAGNAIIKRKPLSHEDVRRISDEFRERGWHRADALLHGWAWEVYRKPWDLFWAVTGWAESGDPTAAVNIYAQFADKNLGSGRAEAALHSKAGWLLRDLGRAEEALGAAERSWVAGETAITARLFSAILRDRGDREGSAEWKGRAELLDGTEASSPGMDRVRS